MIIQLPYDNVETVKKGHDSMKAWHENMAKSHEIAAAWHASQSEDLSKAMNVPTNPDLYARVKAEAKRRFDVYPSAYANAWLVREYKKRGGKYKAVNKAEALIEKQEGNLVEEEAMLAMALVEIAQRYGKFNEDGSGIWAGYESAEENDDKEIEIGRAHV